MYIAVMVKAACDTICPDIQPIRLITDNASHLLMLYPFILIG